MRDGGRSERALPVTADAHDGSVGAACVHPYFAETSGDATAPIPDRQTQVTKHLTLAQRCNHTVGKR